ncbi:MAG TPA: pitrilysin family protein [Bryobacteraceae bacterium]|nr:pitrilysin family protein [Bryobacteraceae bacterium]
MRIAVILAAAASLCAQSKVERKGLAPVSHEVLRVQLPKAAEFKLDNGLTVLVMEDHKLPVVTMRLIIQGAGALNDPPEVPGLALFTATMLREGTATRTSKQIAEESDRLGATIAAAAPWAYDSVTVTMSGLSDNLTGWLALGADVLLHPVFPESELNKLKQRQKAQLQQNRSSSNFLLGERWNKAIYGDHPASVTAPTTQSIDAITPDMLKQFHAARYAPQNAILGVAGDVKPAELRALLSKVLIWKSNSFAVPETPQTKPVEGRKIYLVDRPGAVQTDVYLGNIAVRRTDPDYVPLMVVNQVLGGASSSRLFVNLREEHGYTYGAYSFLVARKYAGPWIGLANMRTDATEGAMTEFLKEIDRIRGQPVSESELEEHKRAVVAGFALSLEDPDELLDFAITQKMYGFPADYWDTYPAKISAVTAEQVARVAKKYLQPENLQIVAVGDAAKVKPVLDKLGTVTLFDTAGNRK